MTPPKTKKKQNYLPIILGAGGVLVTYIFYERSKANSAAATGLTGGTTIPAAGSTSTTTTQPSTWQQWIDAALSTGTGTGYTNSQLYNDVTGWLSGNCVSQQGYTTIGNLIATLGMPPGYTSAPTLSVCASATPATPPTPTTTPAAPPAADVQPSYSIGQIVDKLSGEYITSMVYDPAAKGYYYLTSQGGVYTSGSAKLSTQNGGSWIGYYNTLNPALKAANGAPGQGLGQFTGGQSTIALLPGGKGYAVTDSTGHTYQFPTE